MHIRTFRAANLQSALAEIREQMGPSASVLHTRQIREGWLGWLGRTQVEVTAGLRETSEVASAPSVATAINNASNQFAIVGAGQGSAGFDRDDLNNQSLSHVPSIAELFFARLLQSGAHEQAASRWLSSAASFAAHVNQGDDHRYQDEQTRWWEHLQRAVARELNLSGPIRTQPGDRHVVALVGPTGVGKTTTVAKLAAGFRIQAKRRVGLLTIDTYRIAAVQQLRAYAEIMDLPMQVVESPDQMEGALQSLGDVDLVLIDTAGRSPRSDARVQQLNQFLRAAQPDETHLVLSATSSHEAIATTLAGFAPVRATAVILTKLDETPSSAAALSALLAAERFLSTPLSYVTNGQQVPDDIELADASLLVGSLLPAMPELPAMIASQHNAAA